MARVFYAMCQHEGDKRHSHAGTAENVISLLDLAINEYAKPREILSDDGSQFWSVRRGESSFDAYCQQHNIEHVLGGMYCRRTEEGSSSRSL